ncbi:hypothetical protein QBC32DRAFT_973 [Pseudoneurospora amorphoporcata]|uniref:Uncharacterized protein n=1 Tax=Pseudoneurospora amorphoporcata TaxID=241081 RepID=A0AAN6P3J4_9PEZI|nr:hypothetical protein QBC32DRAFT_973 [Pseudoneurospora amorphoporcata]
MESTPRTQAGEFDHAFKQRAHLRGKPVFNMGFPHDVFDPLWVAASCRIICYPQKSMQLWSTKSKSLQGPTVVVFVLFPEHLDITKLHCGLQITPIPEAIGEDNSYYLRPIPLPAIPGIPAFIEPPLPGTPDCVPKEWKRIVVYWSAFAMGQMDPVQYLKVKLGSDHFMRVLFSYDDKAVAFALNGPIFTIHNNDRSTEVRKDATGMLFDARDLGWFNFANANYIHSKSVYKRIWFDESGKLPGSDSPYTFHEVPVPPNTVVSGAKDVDIKRPPYYPPPFEFDDDRVWNPVSGEGREPTMWLDEMGTIHVDAFRGVNSPATTPSDAWTGDGNSPVIGDSVSNRGSNHDSSEDL